MGLRKGRISWMQELVAELLNSWQPGSSERDKKESGARSSHQDYFLQLGPTSQNILHQLEIKPSTHEPMGDISYSKHALRMLCKVGQNM
jgi:hypothetical protein